MISKEEMTHTSSGDKRLINLRLFSGILVASLVAPFGGLTLVFFVDLVFRTTFVTEAPVVFFSRTMWTWFFWLALVNAAIIGLYCLGRRECNRHGAFLGYSAIWWTRLLVAMYLGGFAVMLLQALARRTLLGGS